MRRRFENVNMVMGNCFSPVMEGSQFQWSEATPNSSKYVTASNKKKIKMSFGQFDSSKILTYTCEISIRSKLESSFSLLKIYINKECKLFKENLTLEYMKYEELSRYVFYFDEDSQEIYSYKDGVLENHVTVMDSFSDYFYNYQAIISTNFTGNPIPDFYVGVVDNIGD